MKQSLEDYMSLQYLLVCWMKPQIVQKNTFYHGFSNVEKGVYGALHLVRRCNHRQRDMIQQSYDTVHVMT